jgi:tetratricopeptide (TPR) repeat protein/O-antigen ligase
MNTHDKMTLQATVDLDGARGASINPETWSNRFAWLARILILFALVASPWMLGSVEYWSQYWISIALLLALALWWFETALNKRNTQALPYVALLLVVGLIIGLIQVIPLSGPLNNLLIGRQQELYEEFTLLEKQDSASSIPARITLNTDGTWHQLRLLVMALTALLLSCRYFRTPRDLAIFFTTMTVNGCALAIFGMIQKLTSDRYTLFWTFQLTAGGTPFASYVNRNNAAGYLLLCLACAIGAMYMALAVRRNRGPVPIISREMPVWRQFSHQVLYFISEMTAVKLASLIAIVFIAAGVLASLSRGATLGLLVGALMTIFSYGAAKRPKNLGLIIIPISLCVVMLTIWLGFNRQLVERFDQIDTTQEAEHWNARLQTWKDCWESVGHMGPLGAGLGSYETVSRLYRTDKELTVFSHAENQFVQAVVEAGWPGLVSFLLAWGIVFYYSYFLLKIGQSPVTVSAGVAGVFLLWSQLTASFLDFGFYIPANMLTLASLVGVIAYFAHSMAYRLREKSLLRFQFSNRLVQAVLVTVFAGCTLVSVDLNRKSNIQRLRTPRELILGQMTLEQVDNRIGDFRRLVESSPSAFAANELGKLVIHRARLQLYESLKKEVVLDISDDVQKKRIWDETSLVRIHERGEAQRHKSLLSYQQHLNQTALQSNLPIASSWFQQSLRMAPMQPEVQMVQGEIHSILFGIDQGSPYIERSIKLAPSNLMLLRQAAVLYLQAGRFEQAAPPLRTYLAAAPNYFELLMQVVTNQMVLANEVVNYELILEEMLPDNPELIYKFASQFAVRDSLVQKAALERAETLLEQGSQSDFFYVNVLRGRIKRAMGDFDAATNFYEAALRNNPSDNAVRYELVEAFVGLENYEEAMDHAKMLVRSDERNRNFRQLYDEIKLKLEEQLRN